MNSSLWNLHSDGARARQGDSRAISTRTCGFFLTLPQKTRPNFFPNANPSPSFNFNPNPKPKRCSD